MSIQAKKRFGFSVMLFVIAVVALILLNLNWPSRAQTGGNTTVAEATAEEVRKTASHLQPIAWVGAVAPSLEESIAVLHANETIRTTGKAAGVAELEDLVRERPASPWTPAIRNYLGAHHRERGQMSLALDHWQAAWEGTKTFAGGNGKRVADFALAHWTRLLVLLGRTEELTAVYETHGNRVLDRGPLSQMWVRTHEKHLRMQKYSQDSYKCGIYALDQMAQTLKLKYKRAELLRTPSKLAGFSLLELQELSDKYNFAFIPVRRSEEADQLVVPSVIHWKQEHYGTITEQRGELYRVADPSGLGVMWLTAAEINAEASGYFMIPVTQFSPGFVSLTPVESALVHGRGSSCPPEDAEDLLCGGGSGGGGSGGKGSGGGGSGPGGSGCGSCAYSQPASGNAQGGADYSGTGGPMPVSGGMPAWRVSEPHLNLWVDDMPLRYQPAKGPAVEMRIGYKQRYEPAWALWELKVGYNWKCNWSSAVSVEYDVAYVRLPSGGILGFEFPPGIQRDGSTLPEQFRPGKGDRRRRYRRLHPPLSRRQ